MTMATDLLGVTMPEPGTSKLVTVNLEEAAEYGLVAEGIIWKSPQSLELSSLL